jgi:hypothetical protein
MLREKVRKYYLHWYCRAPNHPSQAVDFILGALGQLSIDDTQARHGVAKLRCRFQVKIGLQTA